MPETQTTYAVIRTGGKQYRVTPGEELLVERLAADVDATVVLEPLLLADGGDAKFSAKDLKQAKVTATVLAHERGPKIRIFKYKPKRGYKRRQGHRQELTRLRVEPFGS